MRSRKSHYGKEVKERILDGYNSIYLLDIKRKMIEPYIYNSDVSKVMLSVVGKGCDFDTVFNYFNDRFVVKEDKKNFADKAQFKNVHFELERYGHYYYVFRRMNTQDKVEFVEMFVTNISDVDHALICFRTVSDDVSQIKSGYFDTEFYDNNNNLGRRTVLVIEDDMVNMDILRDILSEHYNVLCAKNGREGIRILKKYYRNISVILLDIYMPIMTGYEFLEEVNDDKLLAQIPIIVTTSNNHPEEEQKCLILGAVDFIGKPYIPGLVLSRVRNVIKLRESAATLAAMEYDSLTGLYTRQAFVHHAEQIISANPDNQYTLIAIDLENYKLTNSQYGERRSDEFLSYFGECIGKMFSKGMTGRFGGDLFIVLIDEMEEIKGEQINAAIKKILRKAPIPHQIAKIGIYNNIDKEMPIVSSCDHVFLAIKRIKGMYKENIIYYTAEMKEQLIEEQYIQECMEEALEKEQFQVYYQPKHDCITEKVIGAEALVRWIHPKYGFMSPGQFIPLFERNGFITKLDSYVVRRVCEDIDGWVKKGYALLPISVNASRRDFFEKGWIDQQLAIINSHAIAPGLIHMEVTESLYVENADTIIEQVKKIQGVGHLIEMDDFGSGYSSLGMLADFPLDVVKLDISFVRRIEVNEVVIDAIINLAHKMGFKVVAEGVETEKQYKILRRLGCDYIQGFYFSKPLTKAEFEEYIMTCDNNKTVDEDIAVNPTKWPVLTQELEIKNTLLECVNTLSSNATEQNKINVLLSIIAKFYGSDHAYIIEYNSINKKINNTFEWYPDEIVPVDNILNYLNSDILDNWINTISEGKEYYTSDDMVAVPLRAEGRIVGFVGVDSPIMHVDSFILMLSISSFIMTELERGRYVSRLEELSYTDSLTGVMNRNAFYRDLDLYESMEEKQSLGIVFADINGLKGQNDKGGHKAGDYLIKNIANVIKEQFEDSSIYRIGGDEFVVFCLGENKEVFEERVEILKKSWIEGNTASVGSVWLSEVSDIEKSIAVADKVMYKEKNHFYKEKVNDRRRARNEDDTVSILQKFMDSIPGGFFMYTSDEEEKLISFNKELIRMFKCKDENDFIKFTGGTFEGMVHPDDYEIISGDIKQQIKKHYDTDYVEYRIVTKDGSSTKIRDYGRFVHTSMYGDIFYVFIVEA